MTFRPLPLMSVFTLISLAILIWLGNWQYGRYTDKLGRDPEVAPQQFETVRAVPDVSNTGAAQNVYGIIDGEAVWRRYVPGRIEGEDGIVLILWDATSGTAPVPLQIADTEPTERDANVFVREASRQGMGGRNRPEENQWYTFDGKAMLEALGYTPADTPRVVEPDRITLRLAEDTSRQRETENPYATPVVRDPMPPERHFGYALTWWGLAMALIGVYAAFHHARGRLRFKD